MASTLEELAGAAWPDLTPEEGRVVTAAGSGGTEEFARPTAVRPGVIRWLYTDREAKALLDPLGVRIANARIDGHLDLRNVNTDALLGLHRCDIDGEIRLNDARLRSVTLNGTSCLALLAWRTQISGVLYLEDNEGPFRARSVRLDDSSVSGNVELQGARLGLSDTDEPALSLDRARIGGLVRLDGADLQGTMSAYDARLGGVFAEGAGFRASKGWYAVELVRATVAGSFDLVTRAEGASITRVEGGLVLYGSTVGGSVDLSGVHLLPLAGAKSDEPAEAEDASPPALPNLLDLALSKVGAHLLLNSTMVVDGSITLADTEVGQDLALTHSHLGGDHGRPGVVRVNAAGARVGKRLIWQALVPPDAIVDLRGATAENLIATAPNYWPERGQVWFDGLRYRTIVMDTLYRRQFLAGPSRRLRKGPRTRVRRLATRFADALAGADATALSWLRRHTRRAYDAQPYGTLAAAHLAGGRDAEAVRVLVARADDRRRARGPLAVLLGLPYKLLVGNGFRSWLAALWIVAASLAGTFVYDGAFGRGELTAAKPAGQLLPFQPFVYSLDVLLPIVNLGEGDAYLPAGAGADAVRAFWFAQICLGWLLATALVASAGAALQRRAAG